MLIHNQDPTQAGFAELHSFSVLKSSGNYSVLVTRDLHVFVTREEPDFQPIFVILPLCSILRDFETQVLRIVSVVYRE